MFRMSTYLSVASKKVIPTKPDTSNGMKSPEENEGRSGSVTPLTIPPKAKLRSSLDAMIALSVRSMVENLDDWSKGTLDLM